MKRTFLTLAAIFTAIAVLAGCSAGSPMMDKNESGASYYASDSQAVAEYAAEEPAAPAPSGGYDTAVKAGEVYDPASGTGSDAADVYGGRKIIRNYELSITADDFDADLATIEQRLADFGGYAQSSSVDGKKPEAYGDYGRHATLVLRVPTDVADEFIAGVKGIGTLNSSYDYADDITDAYYDVDTRLAVLETQLERLQSILVETDNLADIIELEARIGEVMLEIEQLTGTLRKYDALVYYTTVTIHLNEQSLKQGPAAVQTTGERISEGFSDSLYGVGTFFTDLFVWLVSALPVLVVLAVIVAAAVLIIRASVKSSRKKKAERMAKAAVEQQALFQKQKAEYEARMEEAQRQKEALENQAEAEAAEKEDK